MDYSKETSMITRVIYTDLDTLYDTKITLLNMIDPRLVREYLSREYDILDHTLYLSNKAFDKIYRERDKRVLIGSKNSSIIDLIRKIVSDIDTKNKTTSAIPSVLHLTINTYPYKFDDDEISAMKEFMSKYVLYLSEVNIIYQETIDDNLLSKINIMIRRDGLKWFMDNRMLNPEFKLPNLKLIVPDDMVLSNLTKMDVDIDKLKEYLETTLMLDVCLEFVEKEAFMLKLEDR
jgi:hypothetical protein